MWKLLTFDGRLASRSAFLPHAVSATCLLFAGFLVVGLAQMGGGAPTSPSPRTFVSGCSQSASSTSLTNVGYTPTTATVTKYRTVTKTLTKTLTRTRTITSYRTRTQTLCRTTTVTGPGSTTTTTETTTAPGSTTTETTTAPGKTTTETVTVTVSGSTSGSTSVSTSAFTCPTTDAANFALGESNDTSDPIFCSYPAFEGENPQDFFCTYGFSTGLLVTDHDAGFCRATAPAKP